MPKPKNVKPQRSLKWRILVFLAVVGSVAALILCIVYGIWAQRFDLKEVENIPERSAVYDFDGKFYSRLERENRIKTSIDAVSPYFTDALLAREDTRFYSHHGVDPIGILRAIVRNIVHRTVKEGASTLTQQLARNSFVLGGHNLHRKILEAFVAMRIEHNYSKRDILDCYVNRIYFGSGLYGVETASQTYFGKPASGLNLSEAAILVGLIRSPNRFSPFKNLKGSLVQRDTVLDRMAQLNKITDAQRDQAKKATVSISKKRPSVKQDNYAMSLVEQEFHALINTDQIDEGGLRIYTTIDPQLQKTAAAAVDQELRKIEQKPGYSHPKRGSAEDNSDNSKTDYLQGSVVVLDNRSGGIRAIVGGRDYSESNFNRAILSPRQVGSTFKPFAYAAAFGKGLLPGGAIDDARIHPGEIKGAGNWNPDNSDGTYKGMLPAEEGLIQSRNTMSVRVGERAGVKEVSRVAALAGLDEVPQLPSAYIGAFDETLKDMTAAYMVFPNDGVRKQSYIIERIDDSDGQVLYRAAHVTAPALDSGISWMVTSILQKVLQHGTAAVSKSLGFNKVAAGKTGTTNDYKDAWFVGYTRSLTCGVWVGLDTPATIMSKGYGSTLALPIWVDVMNGASSQRYPASDFKPPVPLIQVSVCSVSNKVATSGCARAGTGYDITLPQTLVPQGTCPVHQGGAIQTQNNGDQNNNPNVPQKILRSFQHFFGH